MQLHLFWTPNYGNTAWRHERFDTQPALDMRYRELVKQEQMGQVEDLAAKFYMFHGGIDEAAAVREVMEYLNRYDLCEMALPYDTERQDDRIYFNRRMADGRHDWLIMLKRGENRYWLPDAENGMLSHALRTTLEGECLKDAAAAAAREAPDQVLLLAHDGHRYREFELCKGLLRNARGSQAWRSALGDRVLTWITTGVAISVTG